MVFDLKKRRYILKHQSDMTLGDLAVKFKCDWKDIYECYSRMIENGEYKQYRDERIREREKQKIFDRMWSRGG